ncbi:MAG: H-NS histone family protein [Comamonadaceae bacterium]|nr:MAG: H-NS histone family protein [Comamonadaceae bacterium]
MTTTDLQKQIADAEAKINELRQQLAEEKKGQRAEAIASAKSLIKEHGLTGAELGFSGKSSTPKAPKAASSDKRATVAPKFKDPASGKTWTGRGKTPSWLAAELSAGRSKSDFLI